MNCNHCHRVARARLRVSVGLLAGLVFASAFVLAARGADLRHGELLQGTDVPTLAICVADIPRDYVYAAVVQGSVDRVVTVDADGWIKAELLPPHCSPQEIADDAKKPIGPVVAYFNTPSDPFVEIFSTTDPGFWPCGTKKSRAVRS